mmetsp:Transcript_403/g.1796  ORF Transcript_403/g.1796 Transcript_403/m.1796 type:complete len:201 (+) Transcript_403:133-735(+)
MDLIVRLQAELNDNPTYRNKFVQILHHLCRIHLGAAFQDLQEVVPTGQLLHGHMKGGALEEVVVIVQGLLVRSINRTLRVQPAMQLREKLHEELQRPTEPEVRHPSGVIDVACESIDLVHRQLAQQPLAIASAARLSLGVVELCDVRGQVAAHASAQRIQGLCIRSKALHKRQTQEFHDTVSTRSIALVSHSGLEALDCR